MGHRFCKSHWRLPNTDKPHVWRDTPCFAGVKAHPHEIAIQTKLEPTFIWPPVGHHYFTNLSEGKYADTVSKEQIESFINDVLEVCPRVAKRIDEYVFEYQLGTVPNYWKFLFTASLMRSIEEWWLWIKEYHNLRNLGIPKEVCFLCMGLSNRAVGQAACGHWPFFGLSQLKSLRGYSFDHIFSYLSQVQSYGNMELWDATKASTDFFHKNGGAPYPNTFNMTREIYVAFLNQEPDIVKMQALIGGIGYAPVLAA